MQFSIEPDSGVAIYEQLVRQVKFAVADGLLLPGEVIPSVRDMARRLAINPNTVQRAYVQLQHAGVVRALRGRGMAVCADAQEQCIADRQRILGERLSQVIAEMLSSGLPPQQLREMFEQALSQASPS
ncbi:MAG: GntR family transcriptional regulator [Planctomycetales bacterium]|nr:GntR family transcriptional regulator [Planctomycetales bacterium]